MDYEIILSCVRRYQPKKGRAALLASCKTLAMARRLKLAIAARGASHKRIEALNDSCALRQQLRTHTPSQQHTPSSAAKELVRLVCDKDKPLETCCCSKVVSSLWRDIHLSFLR